MPTNIENDYHIKNSSSSKSGSTKPLQHPSAAQAVQAYNHSHRRQSQPFILDFRKSHHTDDELEKVMNGGSRRKTNNLKRNSISSLHSTISMADGGKIGLGLGLGAHERANSHSHSHYSADKSGSSGYYSSNLCSTYSIEDHIYCEPALHHSSRRSTTTSATTTNQLHGDVDAATSVSGGSSTQNTVNYFQDKINENLRGLETSIKNLDRHLNSSIINSNGVNSVQRSGSNTMLPTIMEGIYCYFIV